MLVLSCACGVAHKAHVEANSSVAVAPGSCSVRGKIICIVTPSGADTADICSKYACRAQVQIIGVAACGAGVSLPVNAGELVEMKFAYTLHSSEVIPGLRTKFPGMKKGDVFTANVSQRLVMGGTSEFVVYDYDVK